MHDTAEIEVVFECEGLIGRAIANCQVRRMINPSVLRSIQIVDGDALPESLADRPEVK
jgi:hypothetical protein